MGLNSTSTIKIVDLLCEGPIEGIVGADKGVYLEETPLKTGEIYNYDPSHVEYQFVPGTRQQSQLPQSPQGASHIVDVNSEVGEDYSESLDGNNQVIARDYGEGQLARSITDLDTDAFTLLFTIPALYSTAKESLARGQRFSATVTYEVYVQAPGRSYNLVYGPITLTGIAISNYQTRTPRIQLPVDGNGNKLPGPWNILVKKITNGEEDFEVSYVDFQEVEKNIPLADSRSNRIFWTSLIEHVEFESRYPYTAAVGLTISTEAFQSVPTRAYLIKGKKVKIPSNASVREDGSLEFAGAFDGTLTDELFYTTCPVCCFYDMLTNNGQYGAGEFVDPSNVSWVDLYPLAQYANELVAPDLNNTSYKEPRFAINTVIGAAEEAFDVLRDMVTVFRGMLHWASSAIQCTADHGNLGDYDTGTYTAVDPVHVYTNSNVFEGDFEYSGSSLKTRSTTVRVKYQDPDNLYKANWVIIEDQALIAKYGFQVREVTAFGCTSKYQAQRLGQWLLAVEQLDGETVSFQVGLEGVNCAPGQVFAVQDELRAGLQLSGRVSAANTGAQHVRVDLNVSLPNDGIDPKMTCTMPDGSIETRGISSVSSSPNTINVFPAFSSVPLSQAPWAISVSTVNLQKFRCVTVTDNGKGMFGVLGIEHNDSIYNTADTGQDLEFQDITVFDEAPSRPTSLLVRTFLVNNSINRTLVTWSRGTNGNSVSFDLQYRIGNGDWSSSERTTRLNWEKDGLATGAKLNFRVRAVGPKPIERTSPWVATEYEIPNLVVNEPWRTDPNNPDAPDQTPPPNAEDVTLQVASGNEVILRWKIPNTPDINKSDLLTIIRHSTELDNNGKYGVGTWANSTVLNVVNATTNYAVLPLIEGEYLIKYQNSINGLKSSTATSAVVDIPDPIPKHVVRTDREDLSTPPFDGNHVGTYYNDGTGMIGLQLDGTDFIDDVVDFDSLTTLDFIGDRQSSGTYFFDAPLDLGGKFSLDLKRRVKSQGIYPSDLWDSRDELIDRWEDIDGLEADACSVKVFFRASDETITDDELLFESGDKIQLEDSSLTTDNLMLENNVLYSAWIPMESGRYTGRLFQFKAELTSDAIDQTPVVEELGMTATIQSRTEASTSTITSGAGAKSVTFANAFYETGETPPVSLGITANNMASGDYYVLSSVTRTGFTIHFKNSSNASISRDFDYQVIGYGMETT